jgi:hypothetical protein
VAAENALARHLLAAPAYLPLISLETKQAESPASFATSFSVGLPFSHRASLVKRLGNAFNLLYVRSVGKGNRLACNIVERRTPSRFSCAYPPLQDAFSPFDGHFQLPVECARLEARGALRFSLLDAREERIAGHLQASPKASRFFSFAFFKTSFATSPTPLRPAPNAQC